MKKPIAAAAILLMAALGVTACSDDADVASHNNAKAADNFEVLRRVVFLNGITDAYILTIEGYCSIRKDVEENQLEVMCKIGPDEYKKHFLGVSDNVTYFAEQLEATDDDPYHHRITFKPEQVIPSIDLRTSNEEG